MHNRWIFDGHIAGIGTSSGLRAVVGMWQSSPFGSFADVMVQQPSGHRLLLAPTQAIAEFISATYRFDDVQVVDVRAVLADRALRVDAGPLAIRAATGRRTLLGSALRVLPHRLAVHPRWLGAVSPLASVVAPGARTFGTAGSGRLEYYGVSDLHHVRSAVVSWDGADAGALAQVLPPVTFGFSSVPPRPSLARVRTTVVEGQDPVRR
jgi:zinc transporter ZupT